MIKKKKIIIATGGTGGHVFPALSLSEYLKNNFNIESFSDKRGLKYFENKENIRRVSAGTIFQKNLFKAILLISIFIFKSHDDFAWRKKTMFFMINSKIKVKYHKKSILIKK